MSPLLLVLWLLLLSALKWLVVLMGETFQEANRMLRLLRPGAMEQDGDELVPAPDEEKKTRRG